MTATILVADRATLERLVLEGGLRSSFIAIFGGTLLETADDTPRGDGIGLDDMLQDRKVVCVDDALLAAIDVAATDRVDQERYRNNFVRKLTARQHVWLSVIGGSGEVQHAALSGIVKRLEDAARALSDTDQVRRAVVVLVFTEEMTAKSRDEVNRVRDAVPGIARIYLMTHRLQPADRGSRAVSAHAVWPVCVARLLAARSILATSNKSSSSPLPEIVVWRTLEWGGGRAAQWVPMYRSMLKAGLFNPQDAEGPEVREAGERVFGAPEGLVELSTPKLDVHNFKWEATAEDIGAAGFASFDDAVFEGVLRGSGSHSLRGRALQVGIEREGGIDKEVHSNWSDVADRMRGFSNLRRLRDGRGWPRPDVKSAHEGQRREWGEIIAKRRELDEARENHRDAVEEVSVARSRHLSLLWRLVIAAVVMLFFGQFLSAILVPLRPASSPPLDPNVERQFMGHSLDEKSVAFLVDCSGSMNGERIERLRAELSHAVGKIPTGAPFSIVSFTNETTDAMVFPSAGRGLVSMDDRMRNDAVQWIDSTLEAGGGTDPSSGLEIILNMNPAPASIVLMTDGQFGNPDAVRQAIINAESRHPGMKLPKIHTVALWERAEEPFLKAISERTGGKYRYEGFDPFRPLSFSSVITIVLAATALGVALGAFVPFWLEVRRGRLSIKALRESMAGLLSEFGHVSVDTQKLMRGAFKARIDQVVNAAGSHQRALAARAYGVVNTAIGSVQGGVDDMSGGSRATIGNSLAGEDRRDLARALDSTLAALQDEVDLEELRLRLTNLAEEHSKGLRALWSELCARYDPNRTGHIPSWHVERALSEQLDKFCDRSTLELLFHRCGKAINDSNEVMSHASDDLISTVRGGGVVPVCLSSRVQVSGGSMPDRDRSWIWIMPPEEKFREAAILVNSVRSRVDKDFHQPGNKSLRVSDTGFVALGMVHEELVVEIAPYGGDASDHDVVAGGRK